MKNNFTLIQNVQKATQIKNNNIEIVQILVAAQAKITKNKKAISAANIMFFLCLGLS